MDVIHEEGDFECNSGMDGKIVPQYHFNRLPAQKCYGFANRPINLLFGESG